MSQNLHVAELYTLTSGTLTILYARSVSILAVGGSTNITNSATQSMSIPDGVTMDINADTGNTLSTITISPNSGTSYVTVLSGLCSFAP